MNCLKPFFLGCTLAAGCCVAQKIVVPVAPPPTATARGFKDGRFGVKFEVPPGWMLNRKDRQVSTFHLDARSASPDARVRGIASLNFNPFPYSTLSGALFYYSVEPHETDAQCADEAAGTGAAMGPGAAAGLGSPVRSGSAKDVQDIGGMQFTHGHDEHGEICVEARDEIYTAYRKGSCYRFDMEINTFCAISSGAQEITEQQLQSLNQRMADILSTVSLHWTKTGPHPVPPPELPDVGERPAPKSTQPVGAQAKATTVAARE